MLWLRDINPILEPFIRFRLDLHVPRLNLLHRFSAGEFKGLRVLKWQAVLKAHVGRQPIIKTQNARIENYLPTSVGGIINYRIVPLGEFDHIAAVIEPNITDVPIRKEA